MTPAASAPSLPEVVARVLAREPRAVGRALRLVDDDAAASHALLKALWPHTGKAWVLGVTGNPGAGKSTLVDRLIASYRARGHRVGVVAVDPSSPYTGGAILGDRIRMSRHATDDGVFIRSLATRGHLGGLTRSARDVIRVLDACGHDVVIVETVGVGQDELEITHTAHSTLVVMAPGMGDEVQAIKAGILECADVFAVNKADREGADTAVRDLELMIALGNESIRALSKTRGHATHAAADGFVQPAGQGTPEAPGAAPPERWTPPITRCVASRGDGIDDVVTALDRHRAWLEGTEAGKARRKSRLAEQFRESLRESLIEAAVSDLGPQLDEAVRSVDDRTVDPYTAIERLVATFRAR
ncbi:MAG TPA: methylmalonyl Co-A mutase-associated GTPase MeaB [Polyangiaceae bacterium]|jgi:LAO/AO transport system kinase|nr:methylmalonyl Co-A mutase-associated GTPase MeaB [Polyangiaceae bacterium]